MNAIMGFTGLLKSHLDDRALAQSYIGKIETANDFLLSLINNVLEMVLNDSNAVRAVFNYRKIPETAGFPTGRADAGALRHRRLPEAFPCGKRSLHPPLAGPVGGNG